LRSLIAAFWEQRGQRHQARSCAAAGEIALGGPISSIGSQLAEIAPSISAGYPAMGMIVLDTLGKLYAHGYGLVLPMPHC
jgi:hypothetical protein